MIGYDTRFASAEFARAAAEVLAGNGVRVLLSDRVVPTPVVSWGVVAQQAGGGVVITASHNPAAWNGFKCKSADGASAPVEAVAEIERQIAAIGTADVKRRDAADAISQGL